MKILLYDDTPAYFCHGGKQVHAQKMYESLSALGVDVEYARWWDPAQRCDVIHQFGCSSAIVNMAHEAGAKVVITHLTGSMTNSSWSKRSFHRLRNYVIRNVIPYNLSKLFPWHNVNENDALIYVSKADAETAVNVYGVSRKKIRIIPHGCDSDEIASFASGPRNKCSHLVSVGTIKPLKNSVLLAIAAKRAEVPVVFLGKPYGENDPYYKKFLDLVDGEYVIYPGHVSRQEMVRWLKKSSGFVLPSLMESGCLAVYEAAAAGLPLLLSNKPWAHIYGDNHSAIQYVDLTDEKAFADRLKSFFEISQRLDGPTFPVMTLEEIAKEYLKIYKRVLCE